MEILINPTLQEITLRPANSNIVFDSKMKRWTPRRMVLGSYILHVVVSTKYEAVQMVKRHFEIPKGTRFILQIGDEVETIVK